MFTHLMYKKFIEAKIHESEATASRGHKMWPGGHIDLEHLAPLPSLLCRAQYCCS